MAKGGEKLDSRLSQIFFIKSSSLGFFSLRAYELLYAILASLKGSRDYFPQSW